MLGWPIGLPALSRAHSTLLMSLNLDGMHGLQLEPQRTLEPDLLHWMLVA